MDQINDSLKKINVEIAELESKENHKEKIADSNTIDDGDNDKEEIKQCRFDRVGVCLVRKDKCKFLDGEETCCELYLDMVTATNASEDIPENVTSTRKAFANGGEIAVICTELEVTSLGTLVFSLKS